MFILSIKEKIEQNRFAVFLFLLSFFVHLLASIFLFQKFGDNILYFENEDAHSYVSTAQSIVAGDGFSRSGIPSAARTPVYPLVLSALFFLRLPTTWSILILQNIIASLSGVILFLIGKRFFGERAGKIAGYIYVLEPYMIMTANLATTETFFNFIMICFFYFFSRFYVDKQNTRDLIISAILLALGALTRPIALYSMLLIVLLLAVRFIFYKRMIKQFVIFSAIFCAVFLSVIFPWSLRQHRLFGSWRITNIDSGMMYFRTGSIVVAKQEKVSNAEAIGILKQRLLEKYPDYDDEKVYNSFRYYDFMASETARLVKSEPFFVLKTFATSLIPSFFGSGYDYMLEDILGWRRASERLNYSKIFVEEGVSGVRKVIANLDILSVTMFFGAILWGLIYVAILFRLYSKEVWQKHFLLIILSVSLVGYFIFVSMGIAMHTRYRMPTFPFIFLFLGFALDFLYNKCILYIENKKKLQAEKTA